MCACVCLLEIYLYIAKRAPVQTVLFEPPDSPQRRTHHSHQCLYTPETHTQTHTYMCKHGPRKATEQDRCVTGMTTGRTEIYVPCEEVPCANSCVLSLDTREWRVTPVWKQPLWATGFPRFKLEMSQSKLVRGKETESLLFFVVTNNVTLKGTVCNIYIFNKLQTRRNLLFYLR